MINKKDCKIVQDLLPNYIDKLTANDTNEFIGEHLKECEECNNVFKNMNEKIERENVDIKQEINYAKKYNVKYKKIKYTLLIVIWSLIFIILAFYMRKVFIISKIYKKIDNYQNANNYYMRRYDYYGWYYTCTEIWVKDREMLQKCDDISLDRVKEDTNYDKFMDYEIEITPLTSENFTEEGVVKTYFWYFTDKIKNDLKAPINIFKYSIKSAIVNGKKCYQFISNEDILYFDKETGLVVRMEETYGEGTIVNNKREYQSTLFDFKYEFDVVEDKDLEKYDSEIYIKD